MIYYVLSLSQIPAVSLREMELSSQGGDLKLSHPYSHIHLPSPADSVGEEEKSFQDLLCETGEVNDL